MPRPRIVVDAERPLVDERFGIELTEFPPDRLVTVRARMSLDGHLWESRAVVRTDRSGSADLTEQRPLAGTYDRADPMGLVWSARQIGDRPAPPERTQSDGDLTISAFVGKSFATTRVERQFQTPGVTVETVDDPDLTARRYEPPGAGPHPGVVLLGGSSGGYPSRRAASLLASRGFAVLAVAYFGVPDRPTDLVGVPLEHTARAVEWFAGDERTRGTSVGVVGWSRGGELALQTAVRSDRVGAVVAYVPSTVTFQGNEIVGDPGSAWTVGEEDVPYVPLARPRAFRTRMAFRWLRGTPLSTRPLFERGLAAASSERAAAATIPVEEIAGPLLLVTGDDDRVWPADRLATRAMARLDAHEFDHEYQHLQMPGAGHDIKVPYHPTTERAVRKMALPGRSLRLAMGGTPAGYARADAEAWAATLDTLRGGLVGHDGERDES